MVGLVLVSHSRELAESVRELILQMTSPDFPVGVASGVGDQHDELGTDAVYIADVLQTLSRPDGLLVLMDLGSAVLSAETALELLDTSTANPIRLSAAPLVEGAIAAAVQAFAGGSLEEVAREAERGLAAKRQQLQSGDIEVHTTESQSPKLEPGQPAELFLTVENQHGLHARPAAAFVRTASRFRAFIEVSNLTSERGPVPARSLTSLALLQVRKGDCIRVLAQGSDSEAALRAISQLAADGFGEKTEATAMPALPFLPAQEAATSQGRRRTTEVGGTPGSDGIAIGPLQTLQALQTSFLLDDKQPAEAPASELAKLNSAMKIVSGQLADYKMQPPRANSMPGGEILEAQSLLLSDPVLLDRLKTVLEENHISAARAWIETTGKLASQYQDMDEPYLRERASDVRDIARRILNVLTGAAPSAAIRLERPVILFASELLPSEAVACDPASVLGVITRSGSPTSHSAIILRTLGIPMVVGVSGIDEEAADGKTIAIDGTTGEVWLDPDMQTIERLRQLQQSRLERQRLVEAARLQPSTTVDGTRVEILANLGNAGDAAMAAENGADGVGLLRSEFLFLSRATAPSEEEQTKALCEIYGPISGPIIVRTLDIGADKPLQFLPRVEEDNPYLGVRGVRLSLRSPELFLPHLRAILRSGADREIWLMFPMIATLREVRDSLQLLNLAHQELERRRQPHAWPIKRGVMIEVPAAALMSEQLAEEIDFFSIGTNDLTQYVMAADRGNSSVADLQDALYPAVLRLLKSVIEGAKARGRHVSICGDAASDPLAAVVFTGLGFSSLSVRPKQVAEIKALFRQLHSTDLRQLANDALRCEDAVQVRRLATRCIEAIAQSGRPSVVAQEI